MLKTLGTICHDMFSERDGKQYDMTRILGFIGFIIYNTVTLIHSLHHCYDFNPINYSIGLSVILGVVNTGVTYKYMKES